MPMLAPEVARPMPAEATAMMDAAAAQDALVGDELSALVPKPDKPYSGKVVTSLAKALTAAAQLMGIQVEPAAYTGAVEQLDGDLLRFLAMFEAAAKDYGQPYPVPLAGIKGDSELTAITAHLMRLAKDTAFKDFLEAPAEELPPEGEAMEVMEVEEPMSEPPGTKAPAFDFKSRMRRS